MVKFKIKVAGFVFEINAIYNYVKNFCYDFLTDEKADFSIIITEKDIDFEKRMMILEEKAENLKHIDYRDDYFEHLSVYRKIAEILIDKNVLLFHGSAVAVDDVCYLFTAKSGTGKTTHTEFWLKMIQGAYVVNGDKPLLKVENDKVFVCGSPWRGKENYGVNEIVPLKAICVLKRDGFDHIEEVSIQQVLPMLIQQSYRSNNNKNIMKTLDILETICKNVKFYNLGCTLNEKSALVSYELMRK